MGYRQLIMMYRTVGSRLLSNLYWQYFEHWGLPSWPFKISPAADFGQALRAFSFNHRSSVILFEVFLNEIIQRRPDRLGHGYQQGRLIRIIDSSLIEDLF